MSKLLGRFCCAIAVLCGGANALALPPLGLTQVSTSPVSLSNLELIGESAYLGVPGGVWSVNSSGNSAFIPLLHPTLGTPVSVTRVVDGPDGRLYAGAVFGDLSSPLEPRVTGSAMYELNRPSDPLVSWPEGSHVLGVDRNLRGLGNFYYFRPDYNAAAEMHLDGSVSPLFHLPGAGGVILRKISRNGFALGSSSSSETSGTAPILWTPNGEVTFVKSSGIGQSLRDRPDHLLINIGLWRSSAEVFYGSQPILRLWKANGAAFPSPNVIVSHSNFLIIDESGTSVSGVHGYYPGIIPDYPDRALPLLTIFPELAAVDIDLITDLASVDGYLYMTLSGSNGTFLFGARDPSVIPEPTTLALALFGLIAALATRISGFFAK